MDIGTRVIANGYPGTIVDNTYMEGMVIVRLESGTVIIPEDEALTPSQFLQMTHDTEQADLATLTDWQRVEYAIARRTMSHALAFNSVV